MASYNEPTANCRRIRQPIAPVLNLPNISAITDGHDNFESNYLVICQRAHQVLGLPSQKLDRQLRADSLWNHIDGDGHDRWAARHDRWLDLFAGQLRLRQLGTVSGKKFSRERQDRCERFPQWVYRL